MELKVVEGKKSPNYNTFNDYDFHECEATETRLMGVVALRITWISKSNSRAKLYQVIHLDYSEYGIDDYFEYECIPGDENYHENKVNMKAKWQSFVSVMGGRVIKIVPEVIWGLVNSAIPLAEKFMKSGDNGPEDLLFRQNAIKRLNLMFESLKSNKQLTANYDAQDIIRLTSEHPLKTCNTINYFLMRLVDQDYEAASYLSTMSIEELRTCPLTNQGIQTLIKNKIRLGEDKNDIPRDGFSYPYRCNMTTLGSSCYYYCSLVIYLNKDYKYTDPLVSEINVGTINKLTDYEAAIQVQASEYITVFDCRDRILNNFDGNKFDFLVDVEPKLVNNGWLYTIYNPTNAHVNKSNYWLNDDVYGYALLSIDGEFILMSNDINNISYMDDCTSISPYAPFMNIDGRYQLVTPIFHTLCEQRGVMFRDLIEFGESPR